MSYDTESPTITLGSIRGMASLGGSGMLEIEADADAELTVPELIALLKAPDEVSRRSRPSS